MAWRSRLSLGAAGEARCSGQAELWCYEARQARIGGIEFGKAWLRMARQVGRAGAMRRDMSQLTEH